MIQFVSAISGVFRELHRRRVFRVAALYIVGAWVVMQAADVLFPALGIPDAAIELLQKAFDAGWRGYYRVVNDPRWDPLRADSRFQALMAAVGEHVDAQRAEMERIDAEDGFGVGVDM